MLLEHLSVLLDNLGSHAWQLLKRVSLLPQTLDEHLLEVKDRRECFLAKFLGGVSHLCHFVDFLRDVQHHIHMVYASF